MPTYKENVIEESKRRASEILERIQDFRCQTEVLERELDQISVVLKALGEKNVTGNRSRSVPRIINWGDQVRVELEPGHNHTCERKLMAEIAALRRFTTADAVTVLVASERYAGKPFDRHCIRYYLSALMGAGTITRVKVGQYETVAQPAVTPLSDLVEGE